jgi:hypothetical protein
MVLKLGQSVKLICPTPASGTVRDRVKILTSVTNGAFSLSCLGSSGVLCHPLCGFIIHRRYHSQRHQRQVDVGFLGCTPCGQVDTNVSEEYAASIFRVDGLLFSVCL